MSADSPPLRVFRSSLKRFSRRVKEMLSSRAQITESRMPSPLPPPGQIESRLVEARQNARPGAWSDLKVALELLEKSLAIFPPLKSAVAGFLSVVNVFKLAAQDREEYFQLASNLGGAVDEFREHPGEHTSFKMSEALKAMASGLQQELEHMQEQGQDSGSGQHIKARQDVDDIQECHRRVRDLCRELRNKASIEIWRIAEERQLDARLGKLNATLTAIHDSDLSLATGRRNCTPGTRRLLLEGMRIWANEPKAPKVYWLTGPAGTGKTTLAYTFCAEMKAARRLGASFFCSLADAGGRDASRIIPTIAHQLARLLPAYREELIQRVSKEKDISEWTASAQFERLIRDPLYETKTSVPAGIVVAIDALDECNARDAVQN